MRTLVVCIIVVWSIVGLVSPSYNTPDIWNRRGGCAGPFCCRRKPNALKNLMPNGGTKKTELFTSQNFPKILKIEDFIVDGKVMGHNYKQSGACRVGLDTVRKRRINILIATDPDFNEDYYSFSSCDNQFAFLLPYQSNGHTFMFWEWARGNWFFTSYLTGCDMFVAKSESDPTKALIIHSNMDKYNTPEEQKKNLKEKGEVAQMITSAHQGYRLVMRLYAKPTHPAANLHMEKYQKDHSAPGMKINLYYYDAEQFQDGNIFFGKDGRFYLKPVVGGETKELDGNLA